MPAPIDETVKRRVIQQWLAGEPREKITSDNNIGDGTISIIVDDYKIGLDNFELDSFRELTLQAKKRGMTSSDLTSFIRMYNFFRGSGAKENEIESFITNVNSGYIPPGKAIELINQIYDVSKSESVPPDQLPNYVRGKLEEKQKIDEQIKESDAILQSKNVAVESINEYTKLNEELKKHGLTTNNIHKLLSVLKNAKRYGFDGKEIADKLYDFKFLEWKEKEFRDKRKKLSKRMSKYKDIVPLTEGIAALGVGINELLAVEMGIKEAAKYYNLPYVSAAMQLIEDIKTLNKINGLKREVDRLSLQKSLLDQACSRQSQSLVALAKLKSNGITEDTILELNSFLQNNGYKLAVNTRFP
jgi:hypothetical protein